MSKTVQVQVSLDAEIVRSALARILHTGPDEGWPGRGAACEW